MAVKVPQLEIAFMSSTSYISIGSLYLWVYVNYFLHIINASIEDIRVYLVISYFIFMHVIHFR